MISMFNECKILYILFGNWYVHKIIFEISNSKRFFGMVIKVDPIGDSNIFFLNTDSTYSTEYTMVYKLILTCLLHLPHISDEWGT